MDRALDALAADLHIAVTDYTQGKARLAQLLDEVEQRKAQIAAVDKNLAENVTSIFAALGQLNAKLAELGLAALPASVAAAVTAGTDVVGAPALIEAPATEAPKLLTVEPAAEAPVAEPPAVEVAAVETVAPAPAELPSAAPVVVDSPIAVEPSPPESVEMLSGEVAFDAGNVLSDAGATI